MLAGEVFSTLGTRAPDTALIRGGATYALSDRVRLDGAVGAGLTRQSPEVILTVGVTIALF
jgi:hypothetical protein